MVGGPGPGQDGERRGDPGRETPRQKRLHEKVQSGAQPGRRGVGHGQGGQHHQAQGGFSQRDGERWTESAFPVGVGQVYIGKTKLLSFCVQAVM